MCRYLHVFKIAVFYWPYSYFYIILQDKFYNLTKIDERLKGSYLDQIIELNKYVYTIKSKDYSSEMCSIGFYLHREVALNLIKHIQKYSKYCKYAVVGFSWEDPEIVEAVIDCNYKYVKYEDLQKIRNKSLTIDVTDSVEKEGEKELKSWDWQRLLN